MPPPLPPAERPTLTKVATRAHTVDARSRIIEEGVELPPPSRLELASAMAFAACTVVLPVVVGDCYPFTTAPMFRDSPRLYCRYEVLDPQGVPLLLGDFELQRNYDGNPVGLGAGIRPPPTLDEFGTAPDEAALRAHVARLLGERFAGLPHVDVVQTVIGPVDARHVGTIRQSRVRVHPDGS